MIKGPAGCFCGLDGFIVAGPAAALAGDGQPRRERGRSGRGAPKRGSWPAFRRRSVDATSGQAPGPGIAAAPSKVGRGKKGALVPNAQNR